MIVGGVDLSAVELDNSDFVRPDKVQGRCLSSDGDIIAYNCAGNDDTTRDEVAYNIEAEIKNRMEEVGATEYVLHLTASNSNKGMRHDLACVKQYQVGRIGKPKPKNLQFAREFIARNMNSIVYDDREADDGMAEFQQKYIDLGNIDLVVLDSADKDLRMVQGWHRDPDTGKLICVDGYGSCQYYPDKHKTLGWGYSFFWHQLLMGDSADDIPGLPAFSQLISIQNWPTSDLKEYTRRCEEGTMPSGKPLTAKQTLAAEAKLASIIENFKCKPCGASATVEYLNDCTTNAEAFAKVQFAYEQYYGAEPFEFADWRGRIMVRTARDMLVEQAVLLWMRRTNKVTDVLDFFNQVTSGEL